MKHSIDITEKILYTGRNQSEIHSHFKKWEEMWKFNTGMKTFYHNENIKRPDLILSPKPTIKPSIIPHNRILSISKIDKDEFVLNIELNNNF